MSKTKRYIKYFTLIMIISLQLLSCDENTTAPNHAPIVVIKTPLDNLIFRSREIISFTAEAIDPEDGRLSDSDMVWTSAIDSSVIGVGEEFLHDSLYVGRQLIILSARDSKGNVGVDTVNFYVESYGAPVITIQSPDDSSSFLVKDSVRFKAFVVDIESNTLTGEMLIWSSNIDGELGTGSTLTLNSLSVNDHIVNLYATDNRGNVSYKNFFITIRPNTMPEISITNPFNSSLLILNDTMTFEALATDAEDGYIADSMISWSSDVDGDLGTGRSLTTSVLSRNEHMIITIAIDSDSNIVSDTIHIRIFSPPVVTIISPLDSLNYYPTTNLTFSGSAIDIEDGTLSGNSIVWRSDIDGQIGIGSSFSKSDLSEGKHLITLTATDSDQNIVTELLTIRVTSSWQKQLNGSYFAAILDNNEDTFSVGRIASNNFIKLNLSKQGETLAEETLGNQLSFAVYHMLKTSDNGFALAGYTSAGSNAYVTVAKTGEFGTELWSNSFDYLNVLFLYNTCVGNNGGVLVVGTNSLKIDQYDSTYMFYTKIDANGNLEWSKSFDSTRSAGGGCIATSDNGFIVVGSNYSDSTNIAKLFYTKLDGSGNTVWHKTLSNTNQAFGNKILKAPDGGYTILFRNLETSGNDYNLLKIDESGNVEWQKQYSDFGSSTIVFKTTPSGGYILAGRSDSFELKDIKPYIITTDANGNILKNNSSSEWNSTKKFEVEDVVQTLDGSLILVGNSRSTPSNILIFKTDSNCNVSIFE